MYLYIGMYHDFVDSSFINFLRIHIDHNRYLAPHAKFHQRGGILHKVKSSLCSTTHWPWPKLWILSSSIPSQKVVATVEVIFCYCHSSDIFFSHLCCVILRDNHGTHRRHKEASRSRCKGHCPCISPPSKG